MAGTVIDSLIVTLGLDPKGFTQGQKDAVISLKKTEEQTQKTAKDMEFRGKQAAGFFTNIRNEVLGMLTAFLSTRAILGFTANMAKTGQAMGFLAANTGLSVEELSIWQGMMRQVGATSEEANTNLSNLNSMMIKWQSLGAPSEEMLTFLAMNNVDTDKFTDPLTTMHERILLMSAAFKQLQPTARTTFAGMIGASESFMNMLAAGPEDVERRYAAQKVRNSWTAQDVEAANNLRAAWFKVSEAIDKAGRDLVTNFTPYLIDAFDWVEKIIAGIPEVVAKAQLWTADQIENTVEGFKRFEAAQKAARSGEDKSLSGRALKNYYDTSGQMTGEAWGQSLIDRAKASKDRRSASGVIRKPYSSITMSAIPFVGVGGQSDEILDFLNRLLYRGVIKGDQTLLQQKVSAMPFSQQQAMLADIIKVAAASQHNRAGIDNMLQPTKTEFVFENINIHTQATDAVGIVQSITPAIRNFMQAAKINPSTQ